MAIDLCIEKNRFVSSILTFSLTPSGVSTNKFDVSIPEIIVRTLMSSILATAIEK